MADFVLDSWPILEWLQDKAGTAAKFELFLDNQLASGSRLCICRMNYGEIVYSLAKGKSADRRRALLPLFHSLPIAILSVDDALIDDAVDLKSRFSISYADGFAAALAMRLNAPLLTGDRDFRELEETGILRLEWMGS